MERMQAVGGEQEVSAGEGFNFGVLDSTLTFFF